MTERTCDNCKHNATMKKCHKCHTYEKNGVVHYRTKFKAKKPELSSWDELCKDMERAMLEVNTILKNLDIMSRKNRDRRLKEEENLLQRKEQENESKINR